MSEKYSKLKVKELQELLQKHGLPHSGKKDELIERLVKHDEKKMDDLALEEELGNLDEFDEAKLEELAQDPEFKAMQQQAADSEKQTTAVTAAEPAVAAPASSDEKTQPTEPVEQVKPGSNFKFTPVSFDKPAESDAPSASAKSEAERRMERAKRFGVPVQDTVKKDLRAQKFGSTAPSAKDPASTAPVAATTAAAAAPAPARPKASPVDDETLKKRAERFGLPTKTAGQAAKPANSKKESPKAPLDPEEEEKKRKRAERFGKPAEPVEKKAKV